MADCDEVAARMNANMKAYRERLHVRGLCIRCRQPLEPERARYMLCEVCARKQRLISRARTERLKAKGLCVWCGFRKAVDGATMCRTCKLRQAGRMKKLREAKK